MNWAFVKREGAVLTEQPQVALAFSPFANRLDAYFVLYVIEAFVVTEVFVNLSPKAHKALNKVLYVRVCENPLSVCGQS